MENLIDFELAVEPQSAPNGDLLDLISEPATHNSDPKSKFEVRVEAPPPLRVQSDVEKTSATGILIDFDNVNQSSSSPTRSEMQRTLRNQVLIYFDPEKMEQDTNKGEEENIIKKLEHPSRYDKKRDSLIDLPLEVGPANEQTSAPSIMNETETLIIPPETQPVIEETPSVPKFEPIPLPAQNPPAPEIPITLPIANPLHQPATAPPPIQPSQAPMIEVPPAALNPPAQIAVNHQPQWVIAASNYIMSLLTLQPSITIHRSKLFALFGDFRNLAHSFDPDTSLDQMVLKQACAELIETINKCRQVVYSCSASHWSQSAITWPTTTVKDSVRRIREEVSECLNTFHCVNVPNFIVSDDELNAQNSVDVLQLKGSLLDYLNHLSDQPPTPTTQQISELIKQRIRSIGPVDGIHDGPAVVCISPFLPARLNLVLDHTDFVLGDVIGSGTFGCVHVGTMINTNKKVAIKVLNSQLLGGRQLETFKREVWTMATLNHPSILRLIGVTLSAPFCIVTELLNCSLFDKMRYLSPTKRSIIALRVSQAMEQLHAARIIHRDLKSANILLDDDDLPRVCDFGLVGFKTRGTRTGYVGTAQWMAPEILRSSPFYDEKVDVYSFAVLLWEMLTLQEPYRGMTQDQMVMAIIEKGARPAIAPNYGPPKLIELIRKCWSEDTKDRPSFPQITTALFSAECHFEGTNEEEFLAMSPHTLLSTNIVHAFDCCNWKKLDELLLEVTQEQSESDPELINTIMSLFPSLDSERQAQIVYMLPKMVDLQHFLCMKGYSFIVSLFYLTEIVVDAAVATLRTLDLSSKGFRQVKLIATISHCKNDNALLLCADLCEFEDIAEQIAKHYLPLGIEGMGFPVLKIYEKLLSHKNLVSIISENVEPLVIASRMIKKYPTEVVQCLSNFHVLMSHSKAIVELDLIPLLASVGEVSLKILSQIFVVCTIDQLKQYIPVIRTLVDNYKKFFEEENISLKLLTLLEEENIQQNSC